MKSVKHRERGSLIPIVISALIITLVMTLAFYHDIHESAYWVREGGVIETLSAIGYFLCAFYILLKGGWSYLKTYNYFFLLIILFGCRELDLHKKFTTMGMLKSKFYFSDTVPVSEKLIGIIVLAVLIYIIVSVIRKHGKTFLANVWQMSPVHVGAFATLLLLVVSKSIDGLGRKLKPLGIVLDEQSSNYFRTIEEVLELGIPLMIMATLIIYFSRQYKSVRLRD